MNTPRGPNFGGHVAAKVTPNGPSRLTIVAPNASAEEAAAVVAAVEQFMRATAPRAAGPAPATSAWLTAALREGVARQPDAAPPWA